MHRNRSTNPKVQQLISAIERSNWDWRTVGGLSKETRLPETQIRQLLESNPEIFLRSPVGHRKTGEPIYTTRKKYKKRGFWKRIGDVSSSTSTGG